MYEGYDQDMHTKIKALFEEARSASQTTFYNPPSVYGFTMRFSKDGNPVFEEFGNNSVHGINGFMEPVTDVIEKPDSVTIIVELPGIKKEEVDLRASYESVYIQVETRFRKFKKNVKLSCRILPESTKARFNNGVLEITLQREDEAPFGKKIPVQ